MIYFNILLSLPPSFCLFSLLFLFFLLSFFQFPPFLLSLFSFLPSPSLSWVWILRLLLFNAPFVRPYTVFSIFKLACIFIIIFSRFLHVVCDSVPFLSETENPFFLVCCVLFSIPRSFHSVTNI